MRAPDYPRQRHYFQLAVPVSKGVRGFLLHAIGRRDHPLTTFFVGSFLENIFGSSIENIFVGSSLENFFVIGYNKFGIIP